MEQNKPSLNWVFTLNNYTESDYDALSSYYRYLVVGKEVGDSGTPHLQGYVILNKRSRLSALKKLLPRAHWEIRKGSHEQARDYCMKDGDYIEDGEPPATKEQQGKAGGTAEKRRWDEARENAKKGKFDDIPSDIYMRLTSNIHFIARQNMAAPPEINSLDNHWYVGPPGSGKSSTARKDYPDYYDKPCNKWWDGYQSQETVILDDFDKTHSVLGHHLKRWADHYPFTAEIKGSAINIRPTRIVVTSNYLPEDIFDDQTLVDAVRRRFKIKKFVSL